VSVGIGLPALALQNPAGLSAARIVPGARHGLSERNVFAKLAVFLERAVLQALLIAQPDTRQVEHTILHGAQHALAASGAVALVERRHDAEGEVQPGARIADLRSSDNWWTFAKSGRRCGAAGAL